MLRAEHITPLCLMACALGALWGCKATPSYGGGAGGGAALELAFDPKKARELRLRWLEKKAAQEEAEKTARVTRGALEVSGPCRAEWLLRIADAHLRTIRYCYVKEVTPKLSGEITLSWRVALDGRPQQIIITSSTLDNIKVEGCVKRSVQRWVFPKPEGGVCQAHLSFALDTGP